MIVFIISLIIILFFSIFQNQENFISLLDSKYYYNKPDCIFNKSCQIPYNNINFYDNSSRCQCNKKTISQCKKKCYMKEGFVEVYNTPGINTGKQYPNCPQGFIPNKNLKKCEQICRNCKTGICTEGECYGI